MKNIPPKYDFLRSGGEMAESIAAFNWASTPVGPVEEWPISLKNTIALVLASQFPMFLWWGEDLVQFYNDGYRKILGRDGKHPSALGQKAEDCWTKVWDTIHPLIQQVREKNESVWYEDLPLPVYRNGVYEDAYWTFSYSPVNNDEGITEGVLVVCNETTEKVNLIKQLTVSKEELEFAIDAAELGVWDYNPANKMFKCNTRLKDWFGLRQEDEILLSTATDVIVENDRQRIINAIAYAVTYESGGKFEEEYQIVNPHTGQARWVLAKGRTWFNEDNIAYRFNGTLQDTTQQAEDRERIELSEQNLRNTIMKAPVAMCIFKGSNHVVDIANDRILELWGKTAEEIIGKPQFEGLPEARFQGFEQLLDNVYNTGESYAAQGIPVTLPRNGTIETVYVNFGFEPYYESENNITGIIAVAVNVTEQVVASQKLQESEQQIRAIINSAPFPIGVYEGREMRIALVNQSILDVWDKGNDVVGKTYFEILPELASQDIYPKLLAVYDTGKAYTTRNERVDLFVDGKLQTYYFNYDFTPLFDAEGKVYGVVNTASDVTDLNVAQHKTEEVVKERTNELQLANANLQRSNAELAQFAYIASHDLQEPVRKISIFAQMLGNRIQQNLDKTSENYLNKIGSSAERMQALIRDVLTYSELVKKSDVYQKTDLNEIALGTITDYELLIEQKNATVEYTNLPVIEAIPLQMSQLFGNLVSNSLKYARPGIPPQIHITARELSPAEAMVEGHDGKAYRIEFKDNGIGFGQEYAEKIFNIFQRLHGKTDYSGTGIGLAICKKIVQNHHGTISASSVEGQGAVFSITFPVIQPGNN